jgi:hypothetical protein
VALTGYVQASEAAATTDPVARTTDSIGSGALANIWVGPIYTGYLVATSSEPAQSSGLASLPKPVPPGGCGLNIQNLAHAVQWWIFGGFALALWCRLARDEAAQGTASTSDAVASGAAQ